MFEGRWKLTVSFCRSSFISYTFATSNPMKPMSYLTFNKKRNQQDETDVPGLQKLDKQQLINIIMRKDDLERKLRSEIARLEKNNRELMELSDDTIF